MKKKIPLIFILCITAFTFAACGESCAQTQLSFGAKLPWDMPRLYEKSIFDISEYTMKEINEMGVRDKQLSSGTLTFTLEEADNGNASLDMRTEITYFDIEENGSDRGLTDVYSSNVVFDKLTLAPRSSAKSAALAKRSDKEDKSYSLTVDYGANTETLTFAGKEPQTRNIDLNGQYFDNEQLFYLMRAFPSLTTTGSQAFTLHVPLDAFSYSHPAYGMIMSVGKDTQAVRLENWKGASDYSMDKAEDGTLAPLCYSVSVAINGTNSGTPILATYAANPFAVTQNISPNKVLTSMTTTVYGSVTRTTYYTLTDYVALAPNA